MKTKVMLIGLIFAAPVAAFADVVFQNLTDSPLTVQYQLCYDSSPQPVCSNPINTPSIPPAQKGQPTYNIKQTASWRYVVTLQAWTDDGWQYKDTGMSQNCGNLNFGDGSIPNFGNFSKTYLNPWMQCQSAPGLAIKSK